MPATLVWGKGFRIYEATEPSGRKCLEVRGVDGGQEPISWSSVAEIEELAAEWGVEPSLWPIYRGCEAGVDIPLQDAETRSKELSKALEAIDVETLDRSYWLAVVLRLLRAGNAFFIMP